MSLRAVGEIVEECPLCEQQVARARSVIEEAQAMLVKCMQGKVDPRTGETQRKAALDILTGALAEKMTDDQLLAEVERRAKRLTSAAKKG